MLYFAQLCILSVTVYASYPNSSLYSPKWNEFLQYQGVLAADLFKGYNNDISPVYTKVDPSTEDTLAPNRFNYTILLFSFKLVGVVEPEERVTVVMEVAEEWKDPRLTWNPSSYGNISRLHVRQAKVWSPTLTGFGVNELIDLRDQDFRMAAIDYTGHVYTSVTFLLSTNCPLKVARFPFDSQICQIRFCIPIFYASEVEIISQIFPGIQNATALHEMGNSEWDLVNLTNRVESSAYNDEFGDIELAVFELKIKRNPMYYIYMIVFPSFIINVLSIIGVFMKNSDTMSKLNVGLTNIMTMTFILGVMADKIPKTGNIPLLGIYIIINLFIMIVAVVITMGIVEFKKYAIPKLRMDKKCKLNQKLIWLLDDPLEFVCIATLEIATITNFGMMIVFWITD